MKYTELKRIAEENGYEIKNTIDHLILTNYQGKK